MLPTHLTKATRVVVSGQNNAWTAARVGPLCRLTPSESSGVVFPWWCPQRSGGGGGGNFYVGPSVS